jgi:transcriptional regulator with XRE-family HTH domain
MTWATAHRRVRDLYGSASLHNCVDCGDEAEEWSYKRGAPDEQVSPKGKFSLMPEFYEPRCYLCHAIYDYVAPGWRDRAKEIGNEIRQLRRRAGWGRTQLASELGISPARLSRIEAGQASTDGIAARIEEILQRPPPPKPRAIPDSIVEQVRDEISKGRSFRQTAALFAISPRSVTRIVHRQGVYK